MNPCARIRAKKSLPVALLLTLGGFAHADLNFPGEQFAVSSPVRGIAVDDADGDGHLDIAVIGSLTFHATVFYGDGSGAFPDIDVLNVQPLLPGQGDAIALADVDLDSDLDLVVSGYQGVHVMRNNGARMYGAGALTEHYAVGTTPNGLAVVDVNGDVYPDIAVCVFDANVVAVLINNGDGTYGAPTTIPVGSGPTFVVSADFDGINGPDLAVANATSNTVSVLLNDGVGAFSVSASYTTGTGPQTVLVDDINGDLLPDLVIGCAVGTAPTNVRLNLGAGVFGAETVVLGGGPGIALGDLDGDGDLDLVNGKSASVARVHLNSGAGSFTFAMSGVFGYLPQAFAIADFNEDGAQDLVTGTSANAVSLHLGNGDGTIRFARDYDVGNAAYCSAAADLDDDGDSDVVVGIESGIATLSGFGDGTFDSVVSYASTTPAKAVAIADFDGDTDPDVAVCFTFPLHVVQMFLNDGAGALSPLTAIPVGNYPEAIACGDLDDDDDIDMVVVNRQAKTISIFLNNGDATFAAPTIFATTGTPRDVDLGDVDGDGDLDILHNGGPLVLRFNDGAGAFPTSSNVASTSEDDYWLADMDNDNDLDIVAFGSIRKNNGDGTYGSAVSFSVTSPLDAATVGDIDADGDLDFITTVAGNLHVVEYYLNSGTGSFPGSASSGRRFAAGVNPATMFMADLNNDGVQDIGVATISTESLNVLLGENPAPPPPACAGDINGDGNTNAADFTILAGNFGASVPVGTGGDLNDDGLVNSADFVVLAGDFGCGP